MTVGSDSTADPGVARLNPARSHSSEVIDHEIISTVILFLLLIQEAHLPNDPMLKIWLNMKKTLYKENKKYPGMKCNSLWITTFVV